MNLARAAKLLGPVPRFEKGISDTTRALSEKEVSDLNKRIKVIEQRFPQITIQVVCHSFPLEHPFPLYVFWVFNMGGISTATETAGDNHTILLALDPVIGKSSLMVGYGLEPFISNPALNHVLEQAEPAWIDQAWGEGIQKVLEVLEPLLESAVKEIGASFDLPTTPDEIRGGDF
ncbi:TPM domain-containing protein [Haloferula sp.]|uniref:TPM domain-containing protein n=1 Tax=Haloferula sp. TaxID=2497595 RepID=UPI0032A0D47C